jgi:hypothetical protein
MGSLLRPSPPSQSPPRHRPSVRTLYRGPAGAIDPTVLAPFDAACVRPEAYGQALARVDAHLMASIEELAALTPPERDLLQLSDVLTRARHRPLARRTHAGQLAFPLLTRTDP